MSNDLGQRQAAQPADSAVVRHRDAHCNGTAFLLAQIAARKRRNARASATCKQFDQNLATHRHIRLSTHCCNLCSSAKPGRHWEQCAAAATTAHARAAAISRAHARSLYLGLNIVYDGVNSLRTLVGRNPAAHTCRARAVSRLWTILSRHTFGQ